MLRRERMENLDFDRLKLRARNDAESGRYGGEKLRRSLVVFQRERDYALCRQERHTSACRELTPRVRRSTSHNVLKSCPTMQQTRQTNSWIRNLFIIHLLLQVSALSVTCYRKVLKTVTFCSDSYPISSDQVCSHTQHRLARSLFRPISGPSSDLHVRTCEGNIVQFLSHVLIYWSDHGP